MDQDKLLGRTGEAIAVSYIESLGYQLLRRNYRLHIGEIDIIAKDGEELVFIEVKTRTSRRYGRPAEAVSYYKQRKIARVAQCFMSKYSLWHVPCRFDVLEVDMSDPGAPQVCHIPHAFMSSL